MDQPLQSHSWPYFGPDLLPSLLSGMPAANHIPLAQNTTRTPMQDDPSALTDGLGASGLSSSDKEYAREVLSVMAARREERETKLKLIQQQIQRRKFEDKLFFRKLSETNALLAKERDLERRARDVVQRAGLRLL